MRDRFGARSPASQMLRFHTQTAGSTLAAQQVDVNVVRVTLQALAAVLGGTQSLHTNGRDEALALPTEQSARLALRTQQVIAFESGVADVVDPFGGSYVVERVTDELEAAASGLIAEVDRFGGMVEAIEAGFPQREIQTAAYATQRAIDDGRQKVVGVNCFQEAEHTRPPLQRPDPEVERDQVARVAALRSRRDAAAVSDGLARVRDAAAGADNVLPAILATVKAGGTLGEVSDALRAVYGTWSEVPVL
jgi:methylmalonyl-CoA mutase N-terminal domain/subunit